MQDIFEKRKRHGYRQKEISLIDIFIHSYKVMTTLRKKYENTEEWPRKPPKRVLGYTKLDPSFSLVYSPKETKHFPFFQILSNKALFSFFLALFRQA